MQSRKAFAFNSMAGIFTPSPFSHAIRHPNTTPCELGLGIVATAWKLIRNENYLTYPFRSSEHINQKGPRPSKNGGNLWLVVDLIWDPLFL